MNTQELQDLIQEANELASEMNHLFKSTTEAQDQKIMQDYVEYEDYYCRYLTIQKRIELLLKPRPPVADTVNKVKDKKYMPFILGVMGAAVIWAAIVTVVVVKFDRRHDRLTSEIKALEDSITARNQTISQLEYDKLVLQEDTANYSLRIALAYWEQRAKAWQQLAEEHNLKLQPPPYVK